MAKPAMKPSALSTIYLDNQRIWLMGDPRPAVAKIVAAGGRAPHTVTVLRRQSPDSVGKPVQLDDIIDRTAEPTKAIYLTCKAAEADARQASPAHYVAWPVGPAPTPKVRGPLPAQPAPVPTRPEPAPARTEGPTEPEWGV